MDQLKRCGALTAVVLTLALAACGGSPSAAAPTSLEQVQGVSTPDSVSVVTATNTGD